MKSVIDDLKKIAAKYPVPIIMPHQLDIQRISRWDRHINDIVIIDYVGLIPNKKKKRISLNDLFV